MIERWQAPPSPGNSLPLHEKPSGHPICNAIPEIVVPGRARSRAVLFVPWSVWREGTYRA